jgi:pimeloyl-ACP methyl ester carboxylesterase
MAAHHSTLRSPLVARWRVIRVAPVVLVALLTNLLLDARVSLVLHAQEPSQSVRPASSARPFSTGLRAMATGTQTGAAGEHLDVQNQYIVYVPPNAVGTRRVPLVVAFGGGGVGARATIDLERLLADKYGWILFAPNISNQAVSATQMEQLEKGLTHVLRTYAIDPDKIVLEGMSNGGYAVLDLGCRNLASFSRIAVLSPVPALPVACVDTTRPLPQRTQFYLSVGIGEPGDGLRGMFDIASQLWNDGHPTQMVLELRLHARRLGDRDQLWHWFQRSWEGSGTPNGTLNETRNAPRTPTTAVTAANMPSLTPDVLAKLTTFWTRFRQEPDSLQRLADQYRKELVMPIGTEQVFLHGILDMPALAKHARAAATDLAHAGLTPQQEDGYRLALLSARASQVARTSWNHETPNDLSSLLFGNGQLTPNTSPVITTIVDGAPRLTTVPILAQNLDFLTAHEPAVNALLDLMKVPRCEATEQMSVGGC